MSAPLRAPAEPRAGGAVPPATPGAAAPLRSTQAQAVNLARRPFANTRHIRRLGIALWVGGAVLFATAAVLYWQSLFGIEGKKEERAAIERAIAEERARLDAAERQLATMDLRAQNAEATYLNARIAQRTFPWSELFDRLADVLPRRVRLLSLTPNPAETARRGTARAAAAASRRAATTDRVHLQILGIAESDEALLELLDNLFASPVFDAPELSTEARGPEGIRFQMNVFYLLGRNEPPAAPTPVPAPEPELEEEVPAAAAGGGEIDE